ncbi:ABC transporter ATP-binding protein [Romboutsia lituseburensis]|uniref:ABC transporter ATP-binding protein n=1 Tax=Romboutsia lituseburensis TaxID=1537 RepID=UPI00215ADB7E|nr:ABC transporter ATP-binding protein/permease [Romboutsia lituseburensis]MCR8746655.1 ABC transporter ATP-binding protein/permease [Romboutsia lituseburensis]
MFDYLQTKYDLSNEGLKSLKKGILFSVLYNLSIMIPIFLLTKILSKMLDIVTMNSSNININVIGYTIIGVFVLFIMFVFSYYQYTITYINTYEESSKRRVQIAEHLRKLPLSFFAKKDLSDLTNTIMSDCAGFEHAFSHAIPQFYGSIISTAIVIIALCVLNFKMAIAVFLVAPLAFFIIFISRKLQRKFGKKHMDKKLKVSDTIQETLELVQDIQAYNIQNGYGNLIDSRLEEAEKSQKKSELITATLLTVAQMFLRLGLATVIVVGNNMIINQDTDLFTYILFLIVASMIYDPLSQTMNNLAQIFNTDIIVDRLKKVYNEPILEGDKNIKFDNFDIEFKNVGFSYDKNKNIINNLNFNAAQGKKTALVGFSGSGKSTVLKLAARFYVIDKGKITVGGKEVSNIDETELLNYYSIVFQNVLLFDNTIMENIRNGKKEATDEEVINASKLANCHDFIMELKDGYNTRIGENGRLLSGGEKQRISIARAILKDAPIILLDEITSSLDVENEILIQEAISRVIKDKTVIIIAHKMKTIKNCDNIIVMKDGSKVEEGIHNELMNKKGIYYKLWNIQNESSNWAL